MSFLARGCANLTTLGVILLAAVCACTSTQELVDDGQAALEYHRARYLRLCSQGDSVTAPCLKYGTAVNTLTDVLADTDKALDGDLPKSARADVSKAQKAVEAAAFEVK